MIAIFIVVAFAAGLITSAEIRSLEEREHRETHCIKNPKIRVCEKINHTNCARHCDDKDLE